MFCLSYSYASIGAHQSIGVHQSVVPFGISLEQTTQQLSDMCETLETTTQARTFEVAKVSQTQLTCNGYHYLGKKRNLKLTFNDDELDLIEILNIRDLLPELLKNFKAQYGAPKSSGKWIEYFDAGSVALHILTKKLTFHSKRIQDQYFKHVELIAKSSMVLNLTRDEWKQDLQQLDRYIRNFHVNPFFHHSESNYLKLYYRALKYISNSAELHTDVINGYFEKLVASTGDGHSYVVGRKARYGAFSFSVDWFGDDLYLKGVDEKQSHLLGAKIIAFDTTAIDIANSKLLPFSPSVNSSSFKREAVYLYRHPGVLYAAGISSLPTMTTLTLELSNGQTVLQTFERNRSSQLVYIDEDKGIEKPLYRRKYIKHQWLEYLPEHKAIYLRYGLVVEHEKGDIARLTKQLKEAISINEVQKLVIDIRNSPGGNSYSNAQLINAISQQKNINQHGRLFVLTNRNSFSAAINFAGNMEMRTKTIFIGEKVGDTATFPGESGPQASFQLPNSGIIVNLSFSEWNSSFDYDLRDAIGLDIPVSITINDIFAGKDPVLNAALGYEVPPRKFIKLKPVQQKSWVGRYDFSGDKALRIFEHEGRLKMEVTEWIFSDLYPASDDKLMTDIAGLALVRMKNGNLALEQQGIKLKVLTKLSASDLKPLELLVSGQFELAKKAYKQLFEQDSSLLSLQGNSLGLLASHVKARHNNKELYDQLRDIALLLHGYPILSWDIDDVEI